MVSVFGRILSGMLDEIPGARGAVFTDWEGESVDHATRIDSTEIRLLAAHWGVIYELAKRWFSSFDFSPPTELVMRFELEQVVIRRIDDDYFIAVSIGPEAQLGHVRNALDRTEQRIRDEM